MLFPIQHGLIQMGDAPSLGNVVGKELRQLLCRLPGHGISPGPEGHEKVSVLPEGHIAVHHGADSQGTHVFQLCSVGFPHIPGQIPVTGLKPRDNFLLRISPDSVFQPIFPAVASLGRRGQGAVCENCLDSRRAKLNSQSCSPCPYILSDFLYTSAHCLHLFPAGLCLAFPCLPSDYLNL
ncbi:unknown [Clostridium sp. CAG:149]|nr:unknown [Clostridium sp. CAG:149]